MLLLETMATVPATGLFSLAWLLIVIPLAGAALLLVLGRFSDSWGHWLAKARMDNFVYNFPTSCGKVGRQP